MDPWIPPGITPGQTLAPPAAAIDPARSSLRVFASRAHAVASAAQRSIPALRTDAIANLAARCRPGLRFASALGSSAAAGADSPHAAHGQAPQGSAGCQQPRNIDA
jgi:hypothetical protein